MLTIEHQGVCVSNIYVVLHSDGPLGASKSIVAAAMMQIPIHDTGACVWCLCLFRQKLHSNLAILV